MPPDMFFGGKRLSCDGSDLGGGGGGGGCLELVSNVKEDIEAAVSPLSKS